MKIWIVNPFDNLPVEGYRPQRYWLMAEAFAEAGNAVTYWTQDWSHSKKDRRKMKRDGSAALEAVGKPLFPVVYVPVPGYRKNICIKRIWSHWRFARNWLTMVKSIPEVPELIIVSSPPLFIGREVRLFCARTGTRYIVDIMDAWPETFERIVPRWMLWWMRRMAQNNYRGAVGITAVAQRYLDLARSHGATCPMHLCYHGYRLDG